MKQYIKIELYRCLHSIFLYISLLADVVIVILHFIQDVYPKTINMLPAFSNMQYPYSVFNTTLCLDRISSYHMLYFILLPILVVCPYAGSYAREKQSGYIRQIHTHIDRKRSMIAKYIVVFVSGASVYIIPLLIDFLLTSAYIPLLPPQRGTFMYPVGEDDFLDVLFYEHPWLFLTIRLFMGMIFAGSIACLTLMITNLTYNIFLVLIFPELFVLFISACTELLGIQNVEILHNVSPVGLGGAGIKGIICITEMFLLLIFSFIGFLKGGERQDDY